MIPRDGAGLTRDVAFGDLLAELSGEVRLASVDFENVLEVLRVVLYPALVDGERVQQDRDLAEGLR